ncbi:hypothetical protein [Spiroplasma taiwanense]|uniref:Uncharacterized protein n=1 Tax=Spiroplasma taiwanense CT-1 TaxID=1276220 RepID=S5MGW1_9MOLU|nr:hypothetical protein [Spiroplasma taiwanense]AGR41085.1 hypothetical protein STAIW_v1c04390 [Spiroplasma taiwanense CT-1]
MGKNQKVWLLNAWFHGWNANKTAFAIKSPYNTKGLIWIHKNYYLSSKYKGRFGIEFNILNYKTSKPHYYQEVIYTLNSKIVNQISGEQIAEWFENYNSKNSEEYRSLVKTLNGEKIYD